MRIALIGYGKMGKCLEEAALSRGHEIVARVGGNDPKVISSTVFQKDALKALEKADVCMDFSLPDAVLENTRLLASQGKQIVLGTTGWHAHLKDVEAIINQASTGLIWAPNFSLGVHLFLEIVTQAAKLINHFEQYDVGAYEQHHHQKVDSPSGTAKAISERLLKEIERKKSVSYETVNRPIQPDEIHFSSLRTGSIPGTHTIVFDSPADSITLTHQARNRDGFAQGAVTAAEWIQGKKGIFTISDLVEALTNRKAT